jgi:hypothetical protein
LSRTWDPDADVAGAVLEDHCSEATDETVRVETEVAVTAREDAPRAGGWRVGIAQGQEWLEPGDG